MLPFRAAFPVETGLRDGRYQVGINEIFDSDSFKDLKNKGWTFQAGIGFGSR
jgi:hypothetical protein